MLIEFSATMSLFFVLSVGRVLNQQDVAGSSFNIGMVGLGITFVTVLLFNYATGVSMSVLGTIIVTLSNWMLRIIKSEAHDAHGSTYHALRGIDYWYDVLRALSMIFSQILGGYVGVLLAICVFLQDSPNEFYTIAELMTPKIGIATWLGPFAVSNWTASAMTFVGSFIVHAALLYTFCVKKLQVELIWASLLRGVAFFVAVVLFYNPTGAAFDWFMWLVPASLNMSSHNGAGESYVYLLAPLLGALAAVLFLWFWVWLAQVTNLEADVASQETNGYKSIPNEAKDDERMNNQSAFVNAAPASQRVTLGTGMPQKVY
jgi:hypothetical protein